MVNLKKVVKRSIGVLLGLLIVLPLLLIAINTFDEDPRPEAIVFSDFTNDDVPDEQNGFFVWAGLLVPLGQKPHQRGVEIISQINERPDATPVNWSIERSEFLGANHLQITGELAGLCDREMMDCLSRYRPRESDIERWVRENKVLLDRYHKFYTYPYFRETLKPRSDAPLFFEPAEVARLVRANIALHAMRGNTAKALHWLHDDTVYWRRVLVDSRTLISKMIARAVIWANAQLVSEIIAINPISNEELVLSVDTIRPLTEVERDLSRVFRYELSILSQTFAKLSSEQNSRCGLEQSIADCAIDKLISTLLFNPNATSNLSFESFSILAATSKLPGPQYLKWIGEKRASAWPWSWDIAYNPIGKMLIAIANPAYDRYSGRIHNLDGFLRLVSLQIAIKQAAIRDADIPEYLGHTRPELRNPYTGEPMQWDRQSRALYFNGMGEKSDEELLSKHIELRL